MNKSFIFEKIQPFVDEYACVLLNNKWGVIDKNGNWVIKPKYNYLHSANNCFISKQGNK